MTTSVEDESNTVDIDKMNRALAGIYVAASLLPFASYDESTDFYTVDISSPEFLEEYAKIEVDTENRTFSSIWDVQAKTWVNEAYGRPYSGDKYLVDKINQALEDPEWSYIELTPWQSGSVDGKFSHEDKVTMDRIFETLLMLYPWKIKFVDFSAGKNTDDNGLEDL